MPSVLQRLRSICLALPDTRETLTWGEPHFRVGDKIFAGCGDEGGRATIGFKLEKPHAEARVRDDPRFSVAPYVGRHGWVSLAATRIDDWEEVRALIHESYRLIAPKASRAKLDAGPARRLPSALLTKKRKRARVTAPRSPRPVRRGGG
jgi:predicted DNA-binding protein (MmcQ/YjbR family)